MSRQTTEVLFLTSFTEGCFRAIPAVAQLADDLAVRLTLLYAFEASTETAEAAEQKLASFFPEADRFAGTRRVVCPGPVVAAARSHADRWRVDLIVAPGVDRLRPVHFGASARAGLVADSDAPIWTLGARVTPANLRRPLRRIACWLDPLATDSAYLRMAADLATTVCGDLHVLYVLPDILEGELATTSVPMHESEVLASVADALGDQDVCVSVLVSPGRHPDSLPRLVQNADPDLVVLSARQSVRLFGARLASVVDRVACPVLCVGASVTAPRFVAGRGVKHAQSSFERIALPTPGDRLADRLRLASGRRGAFRR